MACSPGNRHCANCIGALPFPISTWTNYEAVPPSEYGWEYRPDAVEMQLVSERQAVVVRLVWSRVARRGCEVLTIIQLLVVVGGGCGLPLDPAHVHANQLQRRSRTAAAEVRPRPDQHVPVSVDVAAAVAARRRRRRRRRSRFAAADRSVHHDGRQRHQLAGPAGASRRRRRCRHPARRTNVVQPRLDRSPHRARSAARPRETHESPRPAELRMCAKRPAGSVYDRFRPLLADKRRRYAVSSRARSLAQHAVLFFFSLCRCWPSVVSTARLLSACVWSARNIWLAGSGVGLWNRSCREVGQRGLPASHSGCSQCARRAGRRRLSNTTLPADPTGATPTPLQTTSNYTRIKRSSASIDELTRGPSHGHSVRVSASVSVSVCACVFLRDHIFGTTRPIFTRFSCALPAAVAQSSSSVPMHFRFYGWRHNYLLISQGCSTLPPSWNAVHSQPWAWL